jgi:hypothetical protein
MVRQTVGRARDRPKNRVVGQAFQPAFILIAGRLVAGWKACPTRGGLVAYFVPPLTKGLQGG